MTEILPLMRLPTHQVPWRGICSLESFACSLYVHRSFACALCVFILRIKICCVPASQDHAQLHQVNRRSSSGCLSLSVKCYDCLTPRCLSVCPVHPGALMERMVLCGLRQSNMDLVLDGPIVGLLGETGRAVSLPSVEAEHSVSAVDPRRRQ